MSTSTNRIPNVTLSDGEVIPQLGFGVFQVPPQDTAEVATRKSANAALGNIARNSAAICEAAR